jgi:hypothetical protein
MPKPYAIAQKNDRNNERSTDQDKRYMIHFDLLTRDLKTDDRSMEPWLR